LPGSALKVFVLGGGGGGESEFSDHLIATTQNNVGVVL
jgi:hypothetical protein